MLSAFALTNCTQEIENPAQQPESAGYPFEIVASTVDTKTVNDGMHTRWTTKDSLNVFHAVAGSDTYSTNDKFIVSDLEEGRFKGDLTVNLADDKSYDWYALYPYRSKITTPAAESGESFTYIGFSKGLNQKGYNNMASLKGSVCPLYGVAKSVPGSEMPSISMNHLSSVVAINVTNTNDEPLTVTTATLTAQEEIVGSFYIDITKTPVVCNASNGYSYKTATVNVSEGTALEKGQSAILYLVVKPFTAKANSELILSVNGYEKTLTMTKDVTFHAGKIKTVKFEYDYVEVVDGDKIKWDSASDWSGVGTAQISLASGDYTVSIVKGASSQTNPTVNTSANDCRAYALNEITVSNSAKNITSLVFYVSNNGMKRLTNVTSSTGEVRVDVDQKQVIWTGNASSVKFIVGEKADYGTDGNTKAGQLCFDYIIAKTGGAAVNPDPEPDPEPGQPDQPESVELTVAEFLEEDVNDNVYYTLKGTITSVANTTYGNFDLTDDTGTVYIYGLCSPDGATTKYWATSGAKLGDDIVISVPRADFNGLAQGKNARFIELISPGTRAFYTLSTEAVDFPSTGGEHVVTVSAYNTDAVVTASSDNAKFTVAVDGYNVTISSADNDLEEAVTGNVTINVGNLESTIVKVTLAAKPASGVVEGGSDDFHTISATNTSYVTGKTTAGWNYKNCAIFKGGTSDSSPAFKMIGDASNRALCMNGKTSAKGTITSPTLTTGCGTLKFNYGLPFGDTKIKFSVDIMQNGTVVKTFKINNASATKLTKYSHEETINVAGDFQIVFTNLSPSNSTSNKDRTAIWDVEWTGCN